MSRRIAVRIPWPGGTPHMGHARRALVAWLVARQDGGRVVLGGEGEGTELAWLGLDHDTALSAAARAERHAEVAERLRAAGRLYPCFETEEELAWKARTRARRNEPAIYDRGMLKLTAAQRASAEAGGKRPYWRFLLADGHRRWRDRVLGPQSVTLAAHSDPILVRADGTATPALAGAVDDADAGVNALVRDAEQVAATALHVDVVAAVLAGEGTDPARWTLIHLPPDPPHLPTLRRLRQDGIEPTALVPVLAGMPEAAPAGPRDLLAGFDVTRAAPPQPDALPAANRRVLASLTYDAARARLPPGADAAFWDALRGGIDTFAEAAHWWDVVAGEIDPVEMSPIAGDAPPEPWDAGTWAAWTRGRDAAALRLALTGEEGGPSMDRLLPLIGRTRALERLARLG